MSVNLHIEPNPTQTLRHAVSLNQTKRLPLDNPAILDAISGESPLLILLAAGKGTRFGTDPKCIQPVNGIPVARHAINAFRQISPTPAICIVGYRYQQVADALGADNVYIHSEDPAGGTAYAAFEAFCVPQLLTANPLLVITMGDRIVPPEIFQRLWDVHTAVLPNSTKAVGATEVTEAALTLLTAHYEPPRNQSKGRILRDPQGKITGIREQKDIEAETDLTTRQRQLDLTEGNCPLYMTRARTLHDLLGGLTNDNAQKQFYLTDIIAQLAKQGEEIRSITTKPADAAYPLLCADVTRPADLPRLEQIAAAYFNRKVAPCTPVRGRSS